MTAETGKRKTNPEMEEKELRVKVGPTFLKAQITQSLSCLLNLLPGYL